MKRVMIVAAVLCISSTVLAATYDGGSGTVASPYEIRTPEQMNTIGANPGDWASCFKLTADIDMSAYTGTQYNIIGNGMTPFAGTFDGDGHKIRNLTYTITTTAEYVNPVGLFGYTNYATIKNVGVENVILHTDYAGESYVGGLVGLQNYGTITDCTSTGSVTSYVSPSSSSSPFSLSYVGGLVGYQHSGTITHCTSTVSVTSSSSSNLSFSYAGGLVGYQEYGTITDCANTGSVTSSSFGSSSSETSSYAGGLVGYQQSSTITHCTSTGSVTSSASESSSSCAGGLVGYQHSSTITHCTSTGSVTSSAAYIAYAGGLVGYQVSGTITHCTSTGSVTSSSYYFYSSSHSSPSYAGGLVGYQVFGTITDCTNTGSVTSSAAYASYSGGLVGYQGYGTITHCTSTGSATSSSYYFSSYAGGLVGFSSAGDIGSISMSYSAGPVFAYGQTVYMGGLLGWTPYLYVAVVTACFWDNQTSGLTTSAGGTGKTTVEMRTLSTYTDAGWDFTDTDGDAADWKMPALGYPYPAWKGCQVYPAGDSNQDCKVDMADLMILSANWLEGV